MKKKFPLVGIAFAAILLFGSMAASLAETPKKTIEIKGVSKKCLACHGSYDKIQEASAKFKLSDGTAVNPHQFVPHAEKTDIPDCTECHTEHSMPPDKSKIVKPNNVDWCYSSCHHMNNFDACSKCH